MLFCWILLLKVGWPCQMCFTDNFLKYYKSIDISGDNLLDIFSIWRPTCSLERDEDIREPERLLVGDARARKARLLEEKLCDDCEKVFLWQSMKWKCQTGELGISRHFRQPFNFLKSIFQKLPNIPRCGSLHLNANTLSVALGYVEGKFKQHNFFFRYSRIYTNTRHIYFSI